MARFPLLDAMRAQRDRREAEIMAPLVRDVRRLRSSVEAIQRELHAIERAVGSKLAKQVLEKISQDLSESIRRAVVDAVAKATGRKPPRTVRVCLSEDDIRFLDPRSLERSILAQHGSEAIEELSLGVSEMCDQRATMLIVRVPPLTAQRVIAEVA